MAEAIQKRADQLGVNPSLFEELSNLTGPGLAPVRKGAKRAYQPKTIRGVAVALRWPLDWYERLVAGEDWTTFPDTEHPHAPLSPEQRISRLEAQLAELRTMVVTLAGEVRQQGQGSPS